MTSLKDRVRAATTSAGPRAGRLAGTVDDRHDEAADGTPAEEAVGHDEATHSRLSWLRRYEEHFTEALPAHVESGAFFAAVRAVLPELDRCTPASVLQALLTCARFGLIPDGIQAVVKADGPLAVFIPTYRGYVELMYRSGRVGSVHVGMIHERDEWSYEPTAPAPLDFTHKPRVELPKQERGDVVLVYAFCWLQGGARSQVVILSREAAEEIRDEYSEAYRRAEESGTQDSFWHSHFNDMWLKSALRRLAKVVPTSADLRALTAAEDAGEAGAPQILLAPDPEAAELVADAERAAQAAEASQEPNVRPLPVKNRKRGRSKGKKQRGGRMAQRRAA